MLQTINSSCEITVPSHSLGKSVILATGYQEFSVLKRNSDTGRDQITAATPNIREELS